MFALLALICFILALADVTLGTLDLVELGLAFVATHLMLAGIATPWLGIRTRRE